MTEPFADVERVFADQMRAAMRRAGITQRRLAVLAAGTGLAPMYQSTINKINLGKRPIFLREAVFFASAFGLDLQELVRDRPVVWCATCKGDPPAGFVCATCNKGGAS